MYLVKQINTEFSEAGEGERGSIDQRIYNSETSQRGAEDGEDQQELVCWRAQSSTTAETSFTVAEVSIIAVADGSIAAGLSHVRPPGRARDRSLEPGRGLHL